MSYEKSPAEEHDRENPMTIWTDDNTKLEVFAESGGVASTGPDGPFARIRNPQWIVRVKGVEYAGWGEATVDQAERDVQADALAWWAHKRETR